jgi:Fe-S cluster assembly iron-binding protein IscA
MDNMILNNLDIRRLNMLTVTTTAKEKLEETLQNNTEDPEVAIRIIPSPSSTNRLKLALDKEKEGDQVVKNEDGKKILLIGSNLVSALEGMVFDYQDSPQGCGFIILPNTS